MKKFMRTKHFYVEHYAKIDALCRNVTNASNLVELMEREQENNNFNIEDKKELQRRRLRHTIAIKKLVSYILGGKPPLGV